MNLANANLLSITEPGETTTGGDVPAGTVTTLATPPRCICQEVSRAQRITLLDRIATATNTIYVLKTNLPASPVPAAGQTWSVKIDGDAAAASYQIVFVRNWEKAGGLSHWELFGKVVS